MRQKVRRRHNDVSKKPCPGAIRDGNKLRINRYCIVKLSHRLLELQTEKYSVKTYVK